jgi:putative glutamine amidotransferase
MKKLNIGISMRETNAIGYNEKRDSIARDWYTYLDEVMPNANWLLLPNIEKNIIRYIEYWDINAFILIGGEDLGISYQRDNTEKLIFEYSQKKTLPILAICRGFQLVYEQMGGCVKKQNKDFSRFHTANHHEIIIGNKKKIVNSYHSNALLESVKPKELDIIARCKKDNTIEAYEGYNILGFMWHPEREKEFNEWDAKKIKELFKYE